MNQNTHKSIIIASSISVIAITAYFGFSSFPSSLTFVKASLADAGVGIVQEEKVPIHLTTPDPVRAIYMTSWVAGASDLREGLVNLIDETELNAVVIDIKDYTGEITWEKRAPALQDFIRELHRKDIYVIGRISAFQDAKMTKKRPDLGVIRKSDGEIWKDKKGITWLDPGSREVWDYIIHISRMAFAIGIDELNFDYIRFPSDGDMVDIAYRFYNEKAQTKPDKIKEFFAYLYEHLVSSTTPETRPVLSADLFGMTTTNPDDLNIGQLFENAFPFFDYIAPMVYPSHYPPGWNGISNPAASPYEIISLALQGARERLERASTSPKKLRPWIQDFNLGAEYTEEMVRKQKEAIYDTDLSSWMMWSPSNRYTRQALD